MQGNINDLVWVVLTKDGIRVHNEHHEEIAKYSNGTMDPKDYVPKIDMWGYTKYQMWELMHIFGDCLYNGSTTHPFKDNTVYFSEPNC